MRLTIRLIITILATGVVLAGCSDPEPKAPDPKPSVSASPTVPTMPPEAKAEREDGAIAFVKHYVSVFNYASSTGDVSELSKLSSPDCEGCQSYIKLYKETYANGGYFKDSDWKLSEMTAEKQSGELVVFGHVTSRKGEYRKRANSERLPGNEEDSNLTFIPVLKNGSWRLTTLELQAS